MILLLSLSFSVGLAVKRTILLIWTFTVYVSAVHGMGFDINKPLQTIDLNKISNWEYLQTNEASFSQKSFQGIKVVLVL